MQMGILVPSALAVLAAPPHACCLRTKPHCHSSRPGEELTFHAANCVRHDCCRALAATHSAKPQPALSTKITHHCQTIHKNLNFAYNHASLQHFALCPRPSKFLHFLIRQCRSAAHTDCAWCWPPLLPQFCHPEQAMYFTQ